MVCIYFVYFLFIKFFKFYYYEQWFETLQILYFNMKKIKMINMMTIFRLVYNLFHLMSLIEYAWSIMKEKTCAILEVVLQKSNDFKVILKSNFLKIYFGLLRIIKIRLFITQLSIIIFRINFKSSFVCMYLCFPYGHVYLCFLKIIFLSNMQVIFLCNKLCLSCVQIR